MGRELFKPESGFAARVAELIVRCWQHKYFYFPSPLFFALRAPIKWSGQKAITLES